MWCPTDVCAYRTRGLAAVLDCTDQPDLARAGVTVTLRSAAQIGGSARGYLVDLSRRERSAHHWRPRHDSERGLDIYAGHRFLGTHAHAALRYVAPWRSGAPSGSPGTRPCGQLLRFDRSAPHPCRSRNVIGSRMAGARRAAVLVDNPDPSVILHAAPELVIMARRRG